MRISGHAKLAGVVGDPVGHSLSPLIHAHWLRAYGIDGAYVPLAVARSRFSPALEGLRAAGFAGVNVTVPHKEAAFAVADRHDRMALATKAANLLLFEGVAIEARNTDVAGFRASLVEKLGAEGLTGSMAVVLGAGGAARAAVLALGELGVSDIRVLARKLAQAEALARDVGSSTPARITSHGWAVWRQAAAGTSFLVNATSAGMYGSPALELSLDPLPRSAVVCDMVYNPLETTLLKAARARGLHTIDGLGMLMHQAVPAFAAFFGVTPAVTSLLRTELEEVLGAQR